ncbi:hypothetical protein GOV05_04090 [Candidatus Woesearchaeota archaeon]|nr:hypothetical protein [Candidatus Woesearchaeota archaeon]
MDIIDRRFLALPKNKKVFVASIGTAYFLLALISYLNNVLNFFESFLILVIGILYTELLKLNYRVEDLESKKK